MGPIGIPELLIILFIVLLLFGARRLPEAGAGLGKALRSFKDALTGPNSEGKELEPSKPEAHNHNKEEANR